MDAQKRDSIEPATDLLDYANRIILVDHHLESDSDIECTSYVLDKVGSVSTLRGRGDVVSLRIHSDAGSICCDSTTLRDAAALSWILEQGASQVAIVELAQSTLSAEQQSVLALTNTNCTVAHGITVSSVLLRADG